MVTGIDVLGYAGDSSSEPLTPGCLTKLGIWSRAKVATEPGMLFRASQQRPKLVAAGVGGSKSESVTTVRVVLV
jgi:hypothetical protein